MTAAIRAVPVGQALPHVLDVGNVFAVVVASSDGRLLEANRVFQRMLGYTSVEALRGKTLPRGLLRRSDAWEAWSDVVLGAGSREVDVEFLAANDESVRLRGVIERIALATREAAVRAVLVDASRDPRVDELSRSAAHMSAALRLAAGVAHDFNNLLAVLVGNLYLIAERVRGDTALYDKARRARDAAKRGAVLARQILESARGISSEPAPALQDVGRVVGSLASLFSVVLGARIKLGTSIDPNVPPIMADRAELEGVITNLVINARDAVADVESAAVSIEVARREVTHETVSAPLAAGTYVELSVSDNGCGIPDAVVERVFEPFFTTKAAGKGSGLGLPMVRGFAEKSGGSVALRSRAGKGTTISVLLPAHDSEAADTTLSTVPLRVLPRGKETVVVLSDDGEFRTTVAQVLDALGYRCVCGGPATVNAVGIDGGAQAIVIVDSHALTEPIVGRVENFARGHGAHRVVVVGDTRLPWSGTIVRVAKPFTLAELARGVRTAIDGEGA